MYIALVYRYRPHGKCQYLLEFILSPVFKITKYVQ